MYLVVDAKYDSYVRQVYALNSVLGDVGGLFTAFKFLGMLVYTYFQAPLYVSALISKMYQI
jgi:hypothetical protein